MAEGSDVQLRWGVRIPLRDGVLLNATVYLPRTQRAPAPSIFTVTPYVSDSHHERGMYFAAHGLPFVIADSRGRGNSEGTFCPNLQEAKDGYDVVEWLAKQPYCNGKVSMWGSSYLGHNQWVTAKEFPPHLETIIPTAAPWIGVDFPMRNNIPYPYLLQWLNLVSGCASQLKIFSDAALWTAIFREWHESGRPFRELDAALGIPSPIFQEWLAHPELDEYWDARNPTDEDYARLQIPILTITGVYDDDQPGALEHYRRHMLHASAVARARHYLIIGPWNHRGTATPSAEFGGIKCGPASMLDMQKLHLEWYAWTMLGQPKPEFLKKSVAYYVMGLEEWCYADSLEDTTTRYETYFLDSAGEANDVFAAGSLGLEVGTGPPDSYRYDPRETSGAEVEAEARADAQLVLDQTVTLALRGKCLVYHSAPFDRDNEITGFFALSAWIALDTPDTDLYVTVYEVCRDGTSIRLSTDAMRARYREGLRTARQIRTRDPLRYDFERFTFVSRLVRRGHRLRLVIAPVGRVIGVNFTQKNYNGGGCVAAESALDGRPVTVRLFHDEAHPSALRVPIGRSSS